MSELVTTMTPERARRVAWVAAEIMPHEPAVRAWLARARFSHDEIDDFIQDAYCKFAALAAVDHIQNPAAYFYRVVQSLVVDKNRRSRVVRLESLTEFDAVPVSSDEPSAERVVAARRELATVLELIRALPGRCRRVFELRKIEGLSQRDIAARLGITETMVENDVAKGMRLVSTALRRRDAGRLSIVSLRTNGEPRNRRRD